jgi:peptidoglycan/LPS O-acetylase OafA/YrhL
MTSHVPIRVLNFLGGISYPLYLLQYPIFIAAWTFAGIANGYRLLGLCLLGAVLGYILIDVYLRRGWLYIVRRRSAVALQREYGI